MADSFSGRASALDGPADNGFAVSPNDSEDLPHPTRALYVGVGGDVAVELLSGAEIVFANVAQGTVLPVRAAKVLTNSTASAIVGLY